MPKNMIFGLGSAPATLVEFKRSPDLLVALGAASCRRRGWQVGESAVGKVLWKGGEGEGMSCGGGRVSPSSENPLKYALGWCGRTKFYIIPIILTTAVGSLFQVTEPKFEPSQANKKY